MGHAQDMMTPRDWSRAIAFGLVDPCEIAIQAGSLADALRMAAQRPFELGEEGNGPESLAPTLMSERQTVWGA